MKKQATDKQALSEEAFLQNYSIHEYDIPLVTVDMAIFTVKAEKLQVLLVKRSEHPAKGQWALPGGFVDLTKDQQLLDTAKRKLKEKTGIDTPYLEQVETFGSSKRDPRGWSVTIAYFALIPHDYINTVASEGSEASDWVALDLVGKTHPLAFDHENILTSCYERLKSKVHYTSLPINLLPEQFTLSELQTIFEILLGKTVEKKSFRRRILDADIIEETGEMKTGNSRPAKLYRMMPKGQSHYFTRNIEGPR